MKGSIDLKTMVKLSRSSDTVLLTTSVDAKPRDWVLKAATVPVAQRWETELKQAGMRHEAPAFFQSASASATASAAVMDPADRFGGGGSGDAYDHDQGEAVRTWLTA